MSNNIVKLSVLLSANAAQASTELRTFANDAKKAAQESQAAFNGQTMKASTANVNDLGRSVYDATRTAAEKYKSTLESLNALKSTGAISTVTFSRAVTMAGQEMKQSTSHGFSMLAGIGGIKTALLLAAAAAAYYTITVGVKVAAANETAAISFETMLKSTAGAKRMLSDLQQFAASTPFEFSQVRAGAQQMLAYGIAARDVVPMLRIVGDAASTAPQGMAQGLESVTRALGQMKGKGKVSSQEMLQLTEAGINAWEFLAKGIGKTIADTQKMVEDGVINSGTGIKAILEGMQSQFGGNMQKMSGTLVGQWSNLKDNFSLMAGEIADDLLNAFNVKGIVQNLSDFFGWVRSSWKSLMGKEDMGDPLQRMAKATKMAADEVVKKRGYSVSSDDYLKYQLWKGNTEAAKEMEAAIQKNLKALGSMGDTGIKNLSIVKDAISPATAEFQKLKKEMQDDIATLGMNSDEKKLANLKKLGATQAEINEYMKDMSVKKAGEDRVKMFGEGAKLVEDMRTPYETLTHRVEQLDKMLNANAISWQTYDRAITKANEAFREHDTLAKAVAEVHKKLEDRKNKALFTDDQLDMQKLMAAGASQAELYMLDTQQQITAELERQRKIKDEAASLNTTELTGMAKLQAELKRITELRGGGLKAGVGDNMLKKARDEYLKDQEDKNKVTAPGLALAGSQEAYKAMIASTQVGNGKSDAATSVDELIAVTKEAIAMNIDKATYNNGAKEMISVLKAIRDNAKTPAISAEVK